MVRYCKECNSENNFFCDSCVSDYAVNNIAGSCIKKTEFIPSITWKDIFRLELNSEKEINGRNIHGPKLYLRGITNSQINTGHAFLIYLTFKLRQTRYLRNLEDPLRIETICEVINEIEETKNDTNIVDYECIGENKENKIISELIGIDEADNNTELLKDSNLLDIVSQTNLTDLLNKKEPDFKLNDLMKIITFKMDEIKNQTSNNYTFDFIINGTINKESEKDEINGPLKMNKIQDLESDCKFVIEEENKAYLNCKLNVEKYKEEEIFTFKTKEILKENKTIYLNDLDKIFLINKV